MGKSFLFLLLVLILTAAMCLSGTGYAQEAENPEAAESVSAEPAAGETAEEAEAIEPEPAAASEPEATPTIEAAVQKQLDLESGAAAAAVAPAVLSESELTSGNVTVSAEDIYSLGSAHPYQANTIQTAKITLAGAVRLRIRFESDFRLENGYDTFGIYLFDADMNGYRLLDGRTYTGTELAGQIVEVPGETAVLRMESDGSVEENGWQVAEIQAEYPEPTAETPDGAGEEAEGEAAAETQEAVAEEPTAEAPDSAGEEANDEPPASETQEAVTEEPTAEAPETEAEAATEEPDAVINEAGETDTDEKTSDPSQARGDLFDFTITNWDDDDSRLSLYWDSIADCDYYEVRRRLEGTNDFEVIATTQGNEIEELLAPEGGDVWYYDIRAVDEDGATIMYSVDVWYRRTPRSYVKIDAPVNHPDGLLIRWDEVAGAVTYAICAKDGRYPEHYNDYDRCWPAYEGTSTVDYESPSGVTSYYVVFPIRDGWLGPRSNVVGGRHNIQRPGLSAVRINNTQVRLNWTAVPGATGYRIWRSGTSPTSGYTWAVNVGNVTGTVTTLPSPTKTYYYKVAARVEDMIGPVSAPVSSQSTLGRPTIKPILRISANSLRVSWNAVPGASGYRLWRSETSPTSGYTWVANVGNVTAVVTRVPSTKTYYYRVAALSGSTVGPLSAPAAGTTAMKRPVMNPIGKVPGGKFRLTWSSVPGVTGYRLYRSETSATSGYTWVVNFGNVTGTITGAPNLNKRYYYKVFPVYWGGQLGPASNVVTAIYNQ